MKYVTVHVYGTWTYGRENFDLLIEDPNIDLRKREDILEDLQRAVYEIEKY